MAGVDPARIPEAFRDLVPLINVWGVDGDRSGQLRRASTEELQRLIDAVEPRRDEIFEFFVRSLHRGDADYLRELLDAVRDANSEVGRRAGGGLREDTALKLLRRARAYGELQANAFGGAWLGSSDSGFRTVVAAFTGELRDHKTALSPRIRVVAAERTLTEWRSVVAQISEFAESYRGTRVEWFDHEDHDGGRVTMLVDVADEDAFDRDLRARFGTIADVYYQQYDRRLEPVWRWQIDTGGRALTVWWKSGELGASQLLVEEDEHQVRLLLEAATSVGERRSPTSVGKGMLFGNLGPFPDEQVTTIDLAAPLAGRSVVDVSRTPHRVVRRRRPTD